MISPKPTCTGFKTVKAKKYRRKQPMKQEYDIKTSNKFGCLKEEECVIGEVLTVKSDEKKIKKRIKTVQKKHYKTDEIDIPNFQKTFKDFQKHIKTQNRFQILEDNNEEDLNRMIWQSDILKLERKKIKKCHKCNFKKRSCILEPSSCQASQKCCYYCKKN